ncbi:MAG: hypothetical protein IJY71_03570, partial [Clostridia bacterium]|nr:hypothetical protein [Clostridia bacterium]
FPNVDEDFAEEGTEEPILEEPVDEEPVDEEPVAEIPVAEAQDPEATENPQAVDATDSEGEEQDYTEQPFDGEQVTFAEVEEADGESEEKENTPVAPPDFPAAENGEYFQERLDITSVLPSPASKKEEREEDAADSFIPMSSFDDIAEPTTPILEEEPEESPVLPVTEEAEAEEAPAVPVSEEAEAEEIPAASNEMATPVAEAEPEAPAFDAGDLGDEGEERPNTVLFPIGEGRPSAEKAEEQQEMASDESLPEGKDDTDYGIPLEREEAQAPLAPTSSESERSPSAPASVEGVKPPVVPVAPEAPVKAPTAAEKPAASKPQEPQRPAATPTAKEAEPTPAPKPQRTFFNDEEAKPRRRSRANRLEYTSRTQAERIRRTLSKEIKGAKVRLVVAILFAFALLYLENIAVLGAAIPAFLQGGGVDILSAVLLAGTVGLCAKELYSGFAAFFYRRVLPLGIVSVAALLAFFYTLALAILGVTAAPVTGAPRVAFAAALACVLFLYWETVRYENRYSSFTVLSKAGDKLVFSLASPKDALAESNALGKSLDQDIPYIYRVRKTGFVDEFASRTGRICEDSRQNFWLLTVSAAAALVVFVSALIMGNGIVEALGWMLTVLFFALPFSMCATHIYPMARALFVAGENSTILGEKSVNECARLDAVEFEDIEAIPSRKVDVKNVKMYVGDVALVFYCVSSLFHLVGGPICGFFNKSTKELGHTGNVTLKESVAGGLCATVDKFHVLVGDGEYMQKNGVKLFYDAEDERWIEKGVCIMFAAINHKLCAKFYVQYTMDAAFEHNVMRLHRAGMATIIRTYDPNITNRLLQRISALSDCRVHIVTKTVEQYKDFAAPHLTGGIVTIEDSGKLLQLLFLSLRTRGVIAFSRLLKSVSLCFGVALGVLSFFLLPLSALPSAILGLHHLIWLFITVLWTRCRIRRAKGKKPLPKKADAPKDGKQA